MQLPWGSLNGRWLLLYLTDRRGTSKSQFAFRKTAILGSIQTESSITFSDTICALILSRVILYQIWQRCPKFGV